MIYAYVGLPGSGKSYNVVENQILPALKEGRTVVTNIPLHMERIREVIQTGEVVEFPTERIQQQPDLIDEYARPGVLLVLDEVWRLFPGGQKVTHVPEPFKKLLAEHRHMVDAQGVSMQIVLVTQDLAQIGAFARQLVEQTFLHKKLSHIGASGSFSCTIYRGPVTGQTPSQNLEIRTVHGRYSERVYRYYVSHTMSQAAGAGANEKTVDGRGNLWKRPIFIVIAVGLVVVAILFKTVLVPFFNPEAKSEQAAASVATSRAPGSSVSRAGGSAPVSLLRRAWRVSGFVDANGESFALLVRDDGVTAMIDALQSCQREKFTARCRYQGAWWNLEPAPRSAKDSRHEPPTALESTMTGLAGELPLGSTS